MRDQIALPALQQLNAPINRAYENRQDAQTHRANDEIRVPGLVHANRPTQEIQHEDHENDHRRQLEQDTGDHDVRAGFGRGFAVAGDGGEAAADSLDYERYDVCRGENDDVHAWREEGGAAADDADQSAKGDVGGGGEEDGRDDESDDLH